MKKRILMLGAGFMQGVAIRCAKTRGWEVIAVDGNPHAVCRSLADRFEPIDLKDKESLAAFARKLQHSVGLNGVFTAATDFSASVAWVAQTCGLPGHSYEAALNASDKLRMRSCFAQAGVPSPACIGVDRKSRSTVVAEIEKKGIDFPVVVKPVDNMGARGCRKVDRPVELNAALDDAIRYSRSGTAILEEFMDGPEFSIEALVYDDEIHLTGLADRHIFFPPYFIEMGHTMPTAFSAEQMAPLIAVFKNGIRALGLSYGAAKGDMKLTPKGPMIGEIAGRLSGGYMSGWTFPYASGIDLTGAALDLAVGDRPQNLRPTRSWVSAERAWISIPGIIGSVSGYEAAKSLPYVRDVFPRLQPGDTVDFPRNNVEKCGNCLASAPERDAAVFAAEEACRKIFLRMLPNNPATEAFLSGRISDDGSFPPSVFPVSLSEIQSQYTCIHFDSIEIPVPSNIIPLLDTATDWQGRTLRNALEDACRLESGLISIFKKNDGKSPDLYWKALLRGGIQGIIYIHDNEKT